jgi:hypothetical protein
MSNKFSFVIVVLALFVPAAFGQGLGQSFAVGARVSTLGPGLEVTASLSPKLNARVGFNYFTYARQDEIDDFEIRVQADSDIKFNSFTAFVDYLPFGRGLRLTGGVVFNQNEANVLITPLESYRLNEKEFSPEKIGSMTAILGHKSSVNPYVGIGSGNAVFIGKKLGFSFDLGVLYTNSPRLEMEGVGMIAPTATQAPEIEEKLDGIKLYPLLSLGFSYKI